MHCVLLTLCTLFVHSAFTNEEIATKTIKLCSHDLSYPTLPREDNVKSMQDVLLEASRNSEHRLVSDEARAYKYYHQTDDDNANAPDASERTPVGTKIPVIGSSELVTRLHQHDAGLLSTVFDAYNEHYNLRTGPEDWWYTIIQTVALAIDANSKKEQVRNFFVQHEGKKKLVVRVGPTICIDCVDYSWFFEEMSQKIGENINVPDYVDHMKSDFSTSTPVHKIVAEIALMHSVQEYFEYVMGTLCGIPAIEMKGTKDDWQRLIDKVKDLRKTLTPIEFELGLAKWWKKVEHITHKLMETYNEMPDEDWWSRVINIRSYGSGTPDFRGWFMTDLLNIHDASSIGSAPSGLVSIPMTIDGEKGEEKSAVVAGMIGYKIHQNGTTNGRPSLEPMHGWALFLERNSIYLPRSTRHQSRLMPSWFEDN